VQEHWCLQVHCLHCISCCYMTQTRTSRRWSSQLRHALTTTTLCPEARLQQYQHCSVVVVCPPQFCQVPPHNGSGRTSRQTAGRHVVLSTSVCHQCLTSYSSAAALQLALHSAAASVLNTWAETDVILFSVHAGQSSPLCCG